MASKDDMDVLKIYKEIDRGIERTKIGSFDKSIVIHRLVSKLEDCKLLINRGRVSSDIVEMYKTKIKLIQSITNKNSYNQPDFINDTIITGENIQMEKCTTTPVSLTDSKRSEKIVSLSRDVVQINDIFRDLHAMIENQGEEIDRIEKIIEDSNIKVQSGVELLKEAESMQGFRGKLITGFFVFIAGIGAIIGVKLY